MRKRTKYKSHRSDFFIVLICLSVCAASISFFWRDLNLSTSRSDKEKIAVIHFKHKIAQRKFNDRVVWERLSQNSPLYNEDTIRTADFAQAVIRFIDGTQLDVYENTMLQIYYTEDGVKISIGAGDIQVDGSNGNKQVAVQLDNGTLVKMDSGSRLAAKADASGERNNIEIQSGSAFIQSENGNAEILSSGQSVSIENSGEISRNPLSVTSIPKDLRILNVKNESVPVKLEWKTASASAENEKVIVQTSRTKDFSEIIDTYTTNKDSLDLPADEGVLYWRVFTENHEEKPVEGRVTVENVPPVEILSPAPGSQYTYRVNNPSVIFSWKGNDFADHYKLEVSATPDMKNPLLEEEVSSNSYSLSSLREGSYYCRVTPYYPVNDTGYTDSASPVAFSVVKNDMIRPPLLSFPAENAKIVFKDKIQVLFSWKSDLEAPSYDFIISKDPDFSEILLNKTVFDTKTNEDFPLSDFSEGTYFWKVVRHSSDSDDITPDSPARTFLLSKYVPGVNRLIFPPEEYSVENSKMASTKFIWKLADEFNSGDAESLLQFANDKDFTKNLQEFDSKETLYENISLAPGSYYWRIGVKTSENEAGNYTEARLLNVLKNLPATQITFPKEEDLLVTYIDKATNFSWKKVPEADYYNVRVFDSQGALAAEEKGIRGQSVSFVLPADSYRCSVQACTEENALCPMRLSAADNVSFRLRNPVPLTLTGPLPEAKIEGLYAIKKPVSFSWKENIDKAAVSEFVLYKVRPNGSFREVSSIKNPSDVVNLYRLTEGKYRWTVRASTKDGIPIDAPYESFEITPIPLLKSPVLVYPENNYVIGPVFLRRNRRIIFSWLPVDGATDYIYTLYQKNPDGSLKKIYSEKTSKAEVRIKNLAILDVGDFVWNVTAFSHARDGFEEQKGRTAAGTFKIDFNLPEKVQTIKPGKMYAE